jgi:hypothetical protein
MLMWRVGKMLMWKRVSGRALSALVVEIFLATSGAQAATVDVVVGPLQGLPA